jgi:hypothetical protein
MTSSPFTDESTAAWIVTAAVDQFVYGATGVGLSALTYLIVAFA